MKKQVIAPVLFLLSVIAFNLLFWREQLGVNTLLFTLLLTAVYRTLYPESFHSRSVQLSLAGTWLAAILVTWHHSLMSQVTYVLSLMVMTGMVHRPQLRFLGYGLLLSLVSAFEVPVKWFRSWPVNNLMLKQRISRTFYVARITVLPLLIVSLFYVLYIQASDNFADLTRRW